jgi:hypothetical protein
MESTQLLQWKSSDSGSIKWRLTPVEIRRADHATPSTCNSWHWLRRPAAVARCVQFACGLKPRSFFRLSTGNSSIHKALYITSRGETEIPFSLNKNVMNFQCSGKECL